MEIRAFRENDRAEVVDLWRRCNLTVPWYDPSKDIDRKLQVDPELFLTGLISGMVIASVMGGYEGHRGWINYLAVHPEYRGMGYGREMMEAVEAMIAERGCPKINLQVRSYNKGVIEFYRKLGYRDDEVVSFGKKIVVDSEEPQK
ncbi:MAG: GNAT family acetyltransferase [Candidatus Krumholzibacteriota bacterium]|nr:GNAT family acetyltransferase [Candidatus Krumholzibacteriota bacterium]